MKLLGIELQGTHKVKFDNRWFEVYDENGNEIYCEFIDGDWFKWEYDSNGNVVYYEDSDKYWVKREYDQHGNEIYFENSLGRIIDRRAKELTIQEIEALLGYKIKLKGEDK